MNLATAVVPSDLAGEGYADGGLDPRWMEQERAVAYREIKKLGLQPWRSSAVMVRTLELEER